VRLSVERRLGRGGRLDILRRIYSLRVVALDYLLLRGYHISEEEEKGRVGKREKDHWSREQRGS